MTGRKPKLTPRQASYVRRAFKLRRELCTIALAHKYGVSPATITCYGHDRVKGMRT